MHSPRRQHHAISGLQLEPSTVLLEHERDRSIDAVQHLLVRMAVRRIPVVWAVRPRVAAGGFGAQLVHQSLGSGHEPILRLHSVKLRFLADCNVGRLARWLRALGYDASYHAHIGDGELVREAAAEERVLLTRHRDLINPRLTPS